MPTASLPRWKRQSTSDLALVDKCYDLNGLKKSNSKCKAPVLGRTQNKPTLRRESTIIPITSHLEMFGVNIDDQLKFDNHVSEVSKKVSQQIAVLRRMKRMLPFEMRRDLYLSFIAPHFNYCSETWRRKLDNSLGYYVTFVK